MKKNFLLLILCTSLLSGCELDISIQRFFGLIKEDNNEQKQEENNKNSRENPGKTDNSEQQNGEEDNSSEWYTATINVSGTAFSSVATSAGVQFDSDLSSGAANCERLLSCMNGQIDGSYLTSIYCEKLNTAVFNNICYLCIGTGNPSKDNFNPGTFTISSSAKVYKVEFTAQCYSKELGATDSNAHLFLDSQDNSLEVTSTEDLDFKTFSKDYENGTNSFTFNSQGGRVLLQSLTITWAK